MNTNKKELWVVLAYIYSLVNIKKRQIQQEESSAGEQEESGIIEYIFFIVTFILSSAMFCGRSVKVSISVSIEIKTKFFFIKIKTDKIKFNQNFYDFSINFHHSIYSFPTQTPIDVS